MNAPAVFRFTSSASPDRHITAARILGATSKSEDPGDAGELLVDQLLPLMQLLNIPNGLKAVGYTEKDIAQLVQGTLPQHRVTKLSPRPVGIPELEGLFEKTMTLY